MRGTAVEKRQVEDVENVLHSVLLAEIPPQKKSRPWLRRWSVVLLYPRRGRR